MVPVPSGNVKEASLKKKRKEKRYVITRNVDSERSGEGSSGVPSQDSQDLSAAAAATGLITEKSSESQSVDVTNKGMVNRYLRVFDHVSHFMTHNRT